MNAFYITFILSQQYTRFDYKKCYITFTYVNCFLLNLIINLSQKIYLSHFRLLRASSFGERKFNSTSLVNVMIRITVDNSRKWRGFIPKIKIYVRAGLWKLSNSIFRIFLLGLLVPYPLSVKIIIQQLPLVIKPRDSWSPGPLILSHLSLFESPASVDGIWSLNNWVYESWRPFLLLTLYSLFWAYFRGSLYPPNSFEVFYNITFRTPS